MLSGKQLFIWKIDEIMGGDVKGIATEAKFAGYSGLNVKIIDGKVTMNGDKIHALIEECILRGLKVSLWGYFYGVSVTNAEAEATAAAALINSFHFGYNIDTFLLDIEEEYKTVGSKAWATAFMNKLTALISPMIDLGLCSYRFPSDHPQIPWAEFLAKCDFHAPQVYWEGANNPGAQLQQSYNELMSLKPLPFFPAGAAYCHGGWCATPAQVLEFANKAMVMHLPGVTYWAWHSAETISGMWEALRSIEYVYTPPPDPPPVPVSPVLLKAHVLPTSTQGVNVRKNPLYGSTVYGKINPGKNIWVTKIYPKKPDQQWVGVIVPGTPETSDWSGFSAFTWNSKDLLGWGWV